MKALMGVIVVLVLAASAAVAWATQAPPADPPAQPTIDPVWGSGVLVQMWNAGERRYEIRPVDPATGAALPGYPPVIVGQDTNFSATAAVSADGARLAAVESRGQICEPYAGGTACRGRADALHLVDVPALHEATAPLPATGWAGPLVFSPDAGRLALIYRAPATSTLMLFDARTGELVAQRDLDFHPSLLSFTGDGAALAAYGLPPAAEPGITWPGSPRVLLLDAAALEVEWEWSLKGVQDGDWCLESCDAPHADRLFAHWRPAVVPSQDGQKLYIIHSDEDRLTTVDLAARRVQVATLQAAQSWLERLLWLTAGTAQAKAASSGAYKAAALSPDGAQLYVVGRATHPTRDARGGWQIEEELLGLQVVDVESGRVVARREGRATEVGFSPDGAHLLLSDWGLSGTEVLDAGSLERVALLAGWEAAVTRRIDGRPVILARQFEGESGRVAVLDPASFEIAHSWPADGIVDWLTP